MKKLRNRLLWTLLVFILNALLVVYLLRDSVFYSQWFVEPESNNPKPKTIQSHTLPAIEMPKAPVAENRVVEVLHDRGPSHIGALVPSSNCKTQMATSNTIYQWEDEQGVITLSNRKPPSFRKAQLVAEIKPENITIDLIGDIPEHGFRTLLRARIDAAIAYFAQVTDQSLITPVLIKIRLFNKKANFDAYRQQVAPTIGAAPAFYSSAKNESAVYLGKGEAGLNSATHEAMHAINRAWFGNMATWLNEGMAEVAESAGGASVWQNHAALLEPSLSLSELVNASRERWQESNTEAFYALSWAFTSYLLEKHATALAALLLIEASNGCNTVTEEDLTRLLGMEMAALSRDFTHWLL